ncbi:MAG: hypothetical protein FJ026_17060, partial [Chloroflexi bacterium]|nr:hypothetical protein [Chloroflexota bacterium]
PATLTVVEGDTFAVTIRLAASSQPVDGAEAHLDFDPAYLRVVDAQGDPASDIENSGVLDLVIHNKVDNVVGQINFAAGTLGAAPSGDLALATVHFRALASTGAAGTDLLWGRQLPRRCEVTYAGYSVLGQMYDGWVQITTPTPTPTATATPIIYRLYLPVLLR